MGRGLMVVVHRCRSGAEVDGSVSSGGRSREKIIGIGRWWYVWKPTKGRNNNKKQLCRGEIGAEIIGEVRIDEGDLVCG
ncbi:hypothetical protein GOBAR_DD02373 [Gossypium barbadense]|nr:hypothetical protein GOBAR_DD02373 [Gossypium barbadense]